MPDPLVHEANPDSMDGSYIQFHNLHHR